MALIDPGQEGSGVHAEGPAGPHPSLSDYAGRPVILYFYPKDDTPGCTQESCEFEARLPAFEEG